jgi:DNA invertase Pin-like site-specific DNA recombinase
MTKKKPLRVALYARCSTDEDRQEALNQLLKLRESCEGYGWQVVREYVDYESGRKGRDKRRDFDTMLEAAGRRDFDLVYFWRLNRFSREGIKKTIHYLDLLANYGVKFKSYTEQYLDSENELIRHMLLGVISYFAEQQAVEISENTKAGLERARKQGKNLGRPPLFGETKNYSYL